MRPISVLLVVLLIAFVQSRSLRQDYGPDHSEDG